MASKSNPAAKDSELEKWLLDIKQKKQIVSDFNQLAPKLQYAKQKQHKYMCNLSAQLTSTFISAANVDNPFSNPEDPFAEFLIQMGHEMQKFQLSEKDHLQSFNQHFMTPIKQFKSSEYKKLAPLKKKYRNLKNKYAKTKNETILTEINKTKNKLIPEIYSIQSHHNIALVNHVHLFWKSYTNLLHTTHNIMEQSQLLHKSETKTAENERDNDNKFEPDFDMKDIDEKVGFTDIHRHIHKFMIKRIHIKTLQKYNRVIYIDATDSHNKIIKFLSLKNNLKEYALKDIEKCEKLYNASMSEVKLKFKDKKDYHYQFESALKREEFVGQLLEYNIIKNKLMSILVGSWNVGDSEFNMDMCSKWFPSSTQQFQDMYVIGLQEVKHKNKWVSGILAHIGNSEFNPYFVLSKTWLMGIGIIVIIHMTHIAKISHLQSATVATGKGNLIGNKGGTAISFQFLESTFLFINCHLAARAERFTKRAKNFTRIVKELKLGILKNVDILHQFTHVIWFGDLNYRVEKEWNDVLHIVNKTQKWTDLVEFDQLYHQMRFDTVFSGFGEGQIEFCPTYRWERERNVVSNKRNQPPSYTDRILYRSLTKSFDLWQQSYDSSPNCFGSDHRPIVSVFKFKPKCAYRANRKYSQIKISFVDLKAILPDISPKYEIQIVFHCLHSSPMIHKLLKGKYDSQTNHWRWPLMELDSLKISPFICDPSFLATTHLFVSLFQKNKCLCHGIVSLFNAFPLSLVDTVKIEKEYRATNQQMQTVSQSMANESERKKKEETPANHKGFNIKLSKEGGVLGTLEGFINIEGDLIRKHMRYSTIDSRKKGTASSAPPQSQTLNKRTSMFNLSFWNKSKK